MKVLMSFFTAVKGEKRNGERYAGQRVNSCGGTGDTAVTECYQLWGYRGYCSVRELTAVGYRGYCSVRVLTAVGVQGILQCQSANSCGVQGILQCQRANSCGVQGILQCQSANSCGGTGDTAVSEC